MAQLCRAISSQLRHVSTIGKHLLNSNIFPTCPHNAVNFGPLVAEICSLVWGTPANFCGFRVLALLLDVAQRRSTKRCTMFARLLHWYNTHAFWNSCPLTEFCQLQNSLCVQVLQSPILAALLHGIRAAAASQTLWLGTRNGITELSQRVSPIFVWAAITLGIGPHSSLSHI